MNMIPIADKIIGAMVSGINLSACNNKSNEFLKQTKIIAPIITEISCKIGHKGNWRWNNIANLAYKTDENILEVPYGMHKTTLLDDAHTGNPKFYQVALSIHSPWNFARNKFTVNLHFKPNLGYDTTTR